MFGRSLYPGLGTSVNDKTVSDKKNNKQQRSRFTFAGPAFSFNGSMVVTAMGLVAMLPDHGIHLYIYVVMRMPLHSGICRSDLVLHHDELSISIINVCVQQSCNNPMPVQPPSSPPLEAMMVPYSTEPLPLILS